VVTCRVWQQRHEIGGIDLAEEGRKKGWRDELDWGGRDQWWWCGILAAFCAGDLESALPTDDLQEGVTNCMYWLVLGLSRGKLGEATRTGRSQGKRSLEANLNEGARLLFASFLPIRRRKGTGTVTARVGAKKGPNGLVLGAWSIKP
jgi:hypothetical protein